MLQTFGSKEKKMEMNGEHNEESSKKKITSPYMPGEQTIKPFLECKVFQNTWFGLSQPITYHPTISVVHDVAVVRSM